MADKIRRIRISNGPIHRVSTPSIDMTAYGLFYYLRSPIWTYVIHQGTITLRFPTLKD